jgi:hypothetical protein
VQARVMAASPPNSGAKPDIAGLRLCATFCHERSVATRLQRSAFVRRGS